jgi:hypothetical protein
MAKAPALSDPGLNFVHPQIHTPEDAHNPTNLTDFSFPDILQKLPHPSFGDMVLWYLRKFWSLIS